MSNDCPYCGVEQIEDSKFCSACGKEIEQHPVTQLQSQPQQQEEQQQTSVPLSTTKKSKKKLIIGILSIIITLVIVIVAVAYLLGGTGSVGGADSRFVGEWEQNNMLGNPSLWKFNSDSTLDTYSPDNEMNNVGIWNVKDKQLCLYNNTVSYIYEFSNNGNMLTLNISGVNESYLTNIVLTKKDQQGTSQTPNIVCITNSTTNRITIESIAPNVKWRDIAITTSPVTS